MIWLSPNKLSGPDGVEAWTVAFAACTINFVMAGLGRMSGILYVAFIDSFQVDRREASLPFSVRSSMRNLFGPIVGILGQKYGVRPVTMTGAVIGALGAGICFYAQDIIWITVLWGAICGIAAALATTLNQAVIGQHFEKYRTTAAGMAFSGGCVGSFFFPVLLEYLLQTFGMQGTFLIISGILMHVIPAVLLLRKPRWLNKQNAKVQISTVSHKDITTSNIEQKGVKEESPHETSHESNTKQNFSDKYFVKDQLQSETYSTVKSFIPTHSSKFNSSRKINKDFLWDNRQFIINLLMKNSQENPINVKAFYRVISTEYNEIKEIEETFHQMLQDVTNDNNVLKNLSVDAIKVVEEISSCNEDDKYFSKDNQPKNALNLSVNELSNVNKNSNLLMVVYVTLANLFETDMRNVINILPEADKETLDKIFDELHNVYFLMQKYSESYTENKIQISNSFYSHIKTACNLYTKPIFLLICLCRTVHLLVVMPLFTTLVDFSMDKGLPKEDGKYIIGALSLGDLLGRLCLGWISDRGYVTLPKFMMVGMVFQGAFLAILTVVYSRATLLSAVAVSGCLQGCLFVRHPVLVNRYLSTHEQSIAMGCLNFFSGLLSFTFPIYIGFFRDVIGSYNGILYINGAAAAFTGLIWGFEKTILRLSGLGKRSAKVQV